MLVLFALPITSIVFMWYGMLTSKGFWRSSGMCAKKVRRFAILLLVCNFSIFSLKVHLFHFARNCSSGYIVEDLRWARVI